MQHSLKTWWQFFWLTLSLILITSPFTSHALALTTSPALAPNPAIVVQHYELISSQRLDRNWYRYQYKVHALNQGQQALAVQATMSSAVPHLVIETPQLNFGDLAAGAQKPANTLLLLKIDRSKSASIAMVQANFSSQSVNSAPVADAGSAQSARVGQQVQLSGAGSSDAEGDPLTFQWQLNSRPAQSQAQLSDANRVDPVFTLDVPGNYQFGLIVNDGSLNSPEATVTISSENSAPVADAGPGQTVPVGSVIQLTAAASSDVDGDPLSYSWLFLQRPAQSQASLTDSQIAQPQFTADQAGVYRLGLIVSDGLLSSPQAVVEITTSNSTPVANAGPDQQLQVGATASLSGHLSGDIDGDALSFRWSLLSAPANSSSQLAETTAVASQLLLDQPGSYLVQLIVNDGLTDSVADTVSISSNNLAPLANAGPDRRAVLGQPSSFDGSASSDVDGQNLSYRWSLLNQPAGSLAVLQGSDTVTPQLTPDIAGDYLLQLIVNDGFIDSSADTVLLSTENTIPLANAGVDVTVLVTQFVSLDGSASTDADGDTLSYQWSLLNKPQGSSSTLQNDNQVTAGFFADVSGVYLVQLIVNDGTSFSVADTVLIQTGNSPPVADAGPAQSAMVNSLIVLNGSGSTDVDGDALSYQWSFSSKPMLSQAVLSDPTAVQPQFTLDKAGSYVLQLIVHDGTVASAPAQVIISSVNSAPVAAAGVDQTILLSELAQLDGSASNDVDGDLLLFAWSFSTKPNNSVAVLDNPALVNPSFTPDVAGEYVVQLIVSDGQLQSVADTVRLTTQNTAPIAEAGPAQTVGLLQQVLLNGQGSTDAEQDPLNYRWSLLQQPAGSAATLDNTNLVQSRFVADKAGLYIAQLIVNDGKLDSVPDTVSITTANSTPVAQAGPDQSVILGQAAQLNGNASSDADTDPLSFSWSIIAKPANSSVILQQADTATPSLLADVAGQYLLQLVVNDGNTDSLPDNMLLQVRPPNSRPVAQAGQDQTGLVGQIITLNGSGVDAENDALSYRWTVLTMPAGSNQQLATLLSDANIATPSFTPDVAGSWQFSLVVNDGELDSDADTITVLTSLQPSTVLIETDPQLDTRSSHPLILRLDQPAPDGGLTLNLTSSDHNIATVPATIDVAPGALTAQAMLTTEKTSGSIELTVTGAGLATAQRTIQVQPRTLSLLANLVGLNRSTTGTLLLAKPAPQGGATIQLQIGDPSLLTVSPTTLFIPAGQSQLEFNLTGHSNIGQTQLFANGSSDGYGNSSVNIVVTNRLIEMPNTFEAALDQEFELRVLIAPDPAPAGGQVININSADSSKVEVLTTTVTLAEGTAEASIRLRAKAPGQVSIIADGAGFSPDQTLVNVSVALNLLATQLELHNSDNKTLHFQLESGGRRVAAPASGANISFSSSNSNCVSAPAPITMIPGQSFGQTELSYAGTATLPCTAQLTASEGLFGSDSLLVTVTEQESLGDLAISTGPYLGIGLQTTANVSLPSGQHQGTWVRISVAQPTLGLVSSDNELLGQASIELMIPAGQTTGYFYLQGQIAGELMVQVDAAKYQSATHNIEVTPAIVYLAGLQTELSTIDADVPLTIYLYATNGTTIYSSQEAMPGTQVNLQLSDGVTATLVQGEQSGTSQLVHFASGSANNQNVYFRPLTPGEATLTASIAYGIHDPTYDTRTVNVSAPSIAPSSYTSDSNGTGLASVGTQGYINYQMSGSEHGGIQFTLTSSDPGVALLSTNRTQVGAASVQFSLANGQSATPYIYVQGQSTGTTTLTLSSAVTGTTTIDFVVTQPVFDISTAANISTINPAQAVTVYVYTMRSNGSVYSTLETNPGGLPFTLTTSDPAIAILQQNGVAAASQTATIAGNLAYNNTSVQLKAVAPGSVSINASNANSQSLPVYDTQTVTVTAPSIAPSSYTSDITGTGLASVGTQGYINYQMSGSEHGGIQFTLTSSDPGVALLSTNRTQVGAASVQFSLANGQSATPYIYVQGQSTGTTTLTLSSAVTGTTTIDFVVTQPVFDISTAANISTINPAQAVTVYVYTMRSNGSVYSTLETNPGGLPFTLTTSDSAIAILQQNGVAAASQTATIAGNLAYNNTSVQLKAVTPGSISINASNANSQSLPVYDTQSVTVTAPSIAPYSYTSDITGTGLASVGTQGYINYQMSGSEHGGIQFTLTSSDPGVALLSTNQTQVGAASVQFSLANGQSATPYIYVQGQSTGTTTLTLSSAVTGSTTIDFVVTQPAFDISTAANISTINPAQAMTVYVYTMRSNGSVYSALETNPGGLPFTLTTSDPAIAILQQNGVDAASQTATIAGNLAYNNTSVQLKAVAPGLVSINASNANSQSLPVYDTQTVTVTSPTISLSVPGNIGAGSQNAITVALSGSNHGGTTIRVSSNDSAKGLISPNTSTAGAAFYDLFIANGNTSGTVYLQLYGHATGNIGVTASAAGFSNGTSNSTIFTPMLALQNLSSNQTLGSSRNFYVCSGIGNNNNANTISQFQYLSPLLAPLTINISSSDNAVARLVTTAGTSNPQQVAIAVNQYCSPTSVAAGGVALEALANGTSVVAVSAAGHKIGIQTSQSVTVLN